MVRERPVASAWRISEVWRRVSVIFLPSLPPWARRSESSNFALSLSVTASSTDLRSTPAERSCSSSTLAGIFSSVANWATVLLDIRLSSFAAIFLYAVRAGRTRRFFLNAPWSSLFVEPMGAGTHDKVAGRFFVQFADLGQIVAREHLVLGQARGQLGRHAFEFEQVLRSFQTLFLGDGFGQKRIAGA